MNLSEKTKSELCLSTLHDCCKIAALSAFVRTAGSIVVDGKDIGFSVSGNSHCIEFFAEIIEQLYNCSPVFSIGGKSRISGFSLVNSSGLQILIDLGILRVLDGAIDISLEPDKYIVENECCKRAYVIGSFMGGGSITVPDESKKHTGYHLEFVFSKYLTAKHFCEMLSELGFLPRQIERKDNFVVYFKQNEEIKDLLAYMGADKSVLQLSNLVVWREVKNKTNRTNNCLMYNMDKTVDASIKQRNAIKVISETVGLDKLTDELKQTAKARIKYEDASLNELATKLKISKSCLNHRLRKLVKIAEELQ